MTAAAGRSGVDFTLLADWARGRSLARGLPPPVVDGEALRVDTAQPDEERRYIFATPGAAITTLAATIDRPAILIKACAPLGDLLACLPVGWRAHPQAYFMVCDQPLRATPSLPHGYRRAVRHDGVVRIARITCGSAIVAGGRAVPSGSVYVYDRIATDPAHRRRGLGRAIMAALGAGAGDARHTLTATAAGRRLYTALGWSVMSPYSTAEWCGAAVPADVVEGGRPA